MDIEMSADYLKTSFSVNLCFPDLEIPEVLASF